ncbi:unnamed protein product [Amoebophrya sp. A25]|nr:unnamed protein product [Amoebophrya sp. A25]|eukprot:GSA25T00023214001.1
MQTRVERLKSNARRTRVPVICCVNAFSEEINPNSSRLVSRRCGITSTSTRGWRQVVRLCSGTVATKPCSGQRNSRFSKREEKLPFLKILFFLIA